MPDWRQIVETRLRDMALPESVRNDVAEEIATHLEDAYEYFLREGETPAHSEFLALRGIADWRELAKEIVEAKEEAPMNQRTKEVWLPGLVTLAGSMAALWLLQSFAWLPSPSILRAGPPVMPYVIWLATLPFFGALGAYLSKRSGGGSGTRLLSGIFPALAMLVTLSLGFVVALAIERNPFALQHPIYLAAGVLPWTLFPAAALALGSLPFLGRREAAFSA